MDIDLFYDSSYGSAQDKWGGDLANVMLWNSGHGTFVAGVVHLAAPDAQIRAYRIADAEGYGDGFKLARAIEQAALDGCDVINLSVALLKRHLAVRDAMLYAEDVGALVVAAAGNLGTDDLVYPAAEASAMAVGAVNPSLILTEFSTYGSHLAVCAPGYARSEWVSGRSVLPEEDQIGKSPFHTISILPSVSPVAPVKWSAPWMWLIYLRSH